MFFLSSGSASLTRASSWGESTPRGRILSTPSGCHTDTKVSHHTHRAKTQETHAKLDIGREKVDAFALVDGAAHKRRRDDALLALECPQEEVGELGGGVRHAERRAPRAVLGLDDLVPAVLDPVHERLPRLAALRHGGGGDGALREEGHDGDPRVAADDGDGCRARVRAREACEEAGRAHDVEGGDPEEPARAERARALEHGRDDGHRRVDGVGDDEDVRARGDARDGRGEVAHDARVRLCGGRGECVSGRAGSWRDGAHVE